MRTTLIAVAAALIASVITFQFAGRSERADQAGIDQLQAKIDEISARLSGDVTPQTSANPLILSFTEESGQDAWLRGTNRDGSPRPGPADDQKPLADATNSVCFLTKVEMQGMNGPEDMTGCGISVDEFTNWWQIHAIQGDGTDSSIACNARCIVWE